MKRLLIAAATLAAMAVMAPASAQVFVGADPGGVGVQVGPVGAGIGPRWDHGYYHHRYWHDYAYAGDCRVVRTRIVTPHGHVIWRSRRECY
ncbi:MAG: hypothetical protein ACREB2_11255 [Pseudolabrys sp.]